MRGIAGTRRVGHLGTLDPIATGVLPVMIGQATRLAQFWEKAEKTYEAVVRFGFATTTYDRQGEVTGPVTGAEAFDEEIEAALAPMRGEMRPDPAARFRQKGERRSGVQTGAAQRTGGTCRRQGVDLRINAAFGGRIDSPAPRALFGGNVHPGNCT